MRRRAGATPMAVAVVAGALAVAAGCAAPPFNMGAPLDGKPSIPATTLAPSTTSRKAQVRAERSAGHTVLELRALLALDDADRLSPDERARLAVLLEQRASELRAMGRVVVAADDLRAVERLAPERTAALRPLRARAERDAGDVWLAIGADARARAAYQRARSAGAGDLDVRLAALSGAEPASGTPAAELEAAITALPLRALLPYARAYVTRGGANRDVLERALLAARQEHQRPLTSRLEDALAMAKAPPPKLDESSPPPGVIPASATESSPSPSPSPSPPPPLPPDLDQLVLTGPSISFRLLPLLRSHPDLLSPGPRSRYWSDLLLDEDPTSPEVLELTAVIDGLAGRLGGTERKLTDLVYYSPDRYEGMVRGAAIWEQVGQIRSSCALWLRAARWRDEPDDPAWHHAIACARRDPGAGDWRTIRAYVLSRAPADRRDDIAAALDAP